jgi:hypothetical protein
MPAQMNKQKIEVPPTYDLSDLDKAYMLINYLCNPPHPTALTLGWTLEHALEIAGVNQTTSDDILTAQGDPATICALSTASQISAHLKAQC